MPLLLDLDDLRPGMNLAADIEDSLDMVLPNKWQLTAEDIEFLKKHFSNELVPIAMPALDRAVKFDDIGRDQKVSNQLRKSIAESFKKLSREILSKADLSSETVVGLKIEVVKALTIMQSNPVKTAIVGAENESQDYLAEHTANVLYLSVVIGDKIRQYIREERHRGSSLKFVGNATSLAPLALGAFYHDVGLISHNPLLAKQGGLSKEDIAKIQEHPEKGVEMLNENVSAMAKLIIRCHHENFDGSGYPKGIAGDKIPVYARIVRVADAYCAARSSRVYKRAKSTTVVLYEMIYGDYRNCYDQRILQALAHVIQPFPIGAQLKMQNGETVVVVGHNPKDPFKPKVTLLFDRYGKPMPKEKIHDSFLLSDRKHLKIESFNNEDISFINNTEEQKKTKNQQLDYSELIEVLYP